MAAPVDSARQAFSTNTAGTAHVVLTGSPVAGTLLIVFVRFGAAPGTVTFVSANGDYTLLNGASGDSSDASDDTTMVFYRWADGNEGSSDVLTTANSVKLAGICWEITGAQDPASSAPTISTVAVGTTAANSANPNSVAPADPPKDTLYIAMAGGDGEVGAYTAVPTNYANLQASNSGTGGAATTNVFLGGASRGLTNSSSEDPGAFTHGAHSNGWTAYTVAIRLPSASVVERAAALGATAAISAAGGRVAAVVERAAAITATASIESSAQFWSIFSRAAAVSATAAIEAAGSVVSAGASYSTIDPSRIGEWA